MKRVLVVGQMTPGLAMAILQAQRPEVTLPVHALKLREPAPEPFYLDFGGPRMNTYTITMTPKVVLPLDEGITFSVTVQATSRRHAKRLAHYFQAFNVKVEPFQGDSALDRKADAEERDRW